MKLIKEYIDNSFSRLPDTAEVRRLKKDMQVNMEEKYQELIQAGYSSHEALGTVIAEFGDVDELSAEIDLGNPESQNTVTPIPIEQIREYISAYKSASLAIAFGVSLLILGGAGAAFVVEFNVFNELSGYDDFDEWFIIKTTDREGIEREAKTKESFLVKQLIAGVMIVVLSPIFAIVAENSENSTLNQSIGPVLLLLVSIGVFFLVNAGMQYGLYREILNNGKSVSYYMSHIDDYNNASNWPEKISASLWILAVMIFLVWGLLTRSWHIAWIVFVITGFIQAIISVWMGRE